MSRCSSRNMDSAPGLASPSVASPDLIRHEPEMAHGNGETPKASVRQTSPYAPVSSESAHNPVENAEYRLKHYLWRSLITIAGPLAVLGFYASICFLFLAHPQGNNIFPSQFLSPTWIYYCWFLISVFILGWARTGLATIEASALMVPYLAPLNARELMWHTDTYWANPLGWLRALRSVFWRLTTRNRPASHFYPAPMPSALWILLALIHAFLFVAIPLSGLSLEVVDGFTYGTRPARLYGPNETTFNSRLWVALPQGIRREWESGRQTSPSRGALLYAPHKTRNASATYYEDQAIEASRNPNGTVIHIFAGPAVRESIWGEAWGMSVSISCTPTPLDQLQMIKSDGQTFSVNACSSKEGCDFQWLNAKNATTMSDVRERCLDVPVWLNETRPLAITSGLQSHSLMAAADGWSTTCMEHALNASQSAHNRLSNHDNWTFDHVVKGTPAEEVTNSMFELLLWQSGASQFGTSEDEIFEDYKAHPSPLVTVHNGTTPILQNNGTDFSGSYIGLGVHCDIKSAVGTATLDPDQRTFSNFKRGKAAPSDIWFFFPVDLAPLQIQAISSIAGNQHWGNLNGSLAPREALDESRTLTDSTLAGMHRAIGSTVLPRSGFAYPLYPTLTPENLTLAMYKLLGESVIGLMGEGGVNPWISPTIKVLAPSKYIRPGAVPWQFVLTLLAIWAISTSCSALFAIIHSGPRWAPTLSGFELFKFGAQFRDEVHQLESVDYDRCTSLMTMPGMVGVLPGRGTLGSESHLGFIGLSDVVADKREGIRYTLNRRKAAKGRLFAREPSTTAASP
jgi:hypothetical protein